MSRPKVAMLLVLVLSTSLSSMSSAQATQANQPRQTNGLNVYLDCQRMWCEMDHIRREIPYVNWVRDRADADVHILGTSQSTGGGREFIFNFIGLRGFEGHSDTLRFSTSRTDVRDEERDRQTKTLQMGLMRFVADSPIADFINISYSSPAEGELRAQPEDDPWNYWVFRVGGSGSFNAESEQSEYSVSGNLTATRTTDEWFLRFYARGRFSEDRYELEDDSVAVYRNDTYLVEGVAIRSLSQHWGAGVRAQAEKSVYYNRDFAGGFDGGIEYSVFPYSESTRRALTILYTMGVAAYDYEEITIFNQTSEVRLQQTMEVSLGLVQPWGNTGASLEAATYLHDVSLHSIELSAHMSLRLVRGLRLTFGGFGARIKDQLYLSGAGIPQDERLLRRRALGTDYEVGMHFGLNYTFGSIFNNIVNPRMDDFR